jgi:hypothetical protein
MVFSKANRVLVVLVLAAISTVANAQSQLVASATFNGRLYQVWSNPGISWQQAFNEAQLMTHPVTGVQAHLATATSVPEAAVLAGLNQPTGNRTQAWIGYFQSGGAEPGGGWTSVSGWTIPPTDTTPPLTFENWGAGQPDDSNGGDFAAIGLDGTWADEGKNSNIWAFIVEFGEEETIPATACNPPGCPMTGNQLEGTFVYRHPATNVTIPENATYTATTYLIHDPRFDADPTKNRCGKDKLPLDAEVEVPETLCGDPDFVWVRLESSASVLFERDVAEVTSSDDLLPDNMSDCFAPEPPDIDQTHRAVMAYQASPPVVPPPPGTSAWLEKDAFDSRVHHPALDNKFAELTYKCGSVVIKSPGRSDYLTGLRIYPGVGFESDPRGWLEHYTIFKLDVVKLGLQRAKGELSNGNFTSLMKSLSTARGELTKGNYVEFLAHIKKFQNAHQRSIYPPGSKNYAEVQVRIDNIAFMGGKLQAGQ